MAVERLLVLVSGLAAACFAWGALASLQAERWAVGARVARLAASDLLRAPGGPAAEPFAQRFLLPALRAAASRAARLLPRDLVQRVERRLVLAGRPWRISAADFLGVQTLAAVVLGGLGAWLMTAAGAAAGGAVFLGFVLAVLGAYLPQFLVSSRIAARRRSAVETLPDAVDLMVVCVEAGLGFDAALLRFVEKSQGAFAEEVALALAEMRVGRSRRQALQGIADRLDVPEVRAFVGAVLQSDRLGVPIADVLRAQSEFLRQVRRQRVEEASMKVPVKMIFPMVFCILPTLLMIILGPALIEAAHSLGVLR
jgi:tight adherence protein C